MKTWGKYLLALVCACAVSAVFLLIYDSVTAPRLMQEHFQNPTATVTFKNGGIMEFELYPSCAPNTVGSFISLANSGFYDGLDLNYVAAGAFARGGDPAGDGTGTAGYTLPGEFSENGFRDNSLSHTRGVISLARREDDPNSGSCQFFILQGDFPEFNGRYAAFGKITNEDGYKLLDEICSSAVDTAGTPIRRRTIESIRIETYGAEYAFEIYTDPSASPTPGPEAMEELSEEVPEDLPTQKPSTDFWGDPIEPDPTPIIIAHPTPAKTESLFDPVKKDPQSEIPYNETNTPENGKEGLTSWDTL